jgi:hypothetical protein
VPHYWIIYSTPESIHDKLKAGDWAGAGQEIRDFLPGHGLEVELRR